MIIRFDLEIHEKFVRFESEKMDGKRADPQGSTVRTPIYDGDEIEIIDREMEFSTILDIPLHTRIKSSLHGYFSKIHATVSAPPFIGLLYIIIISIQSFFPHLIIDNDELWPERSFLTTILRIFAYLWVGPSNNKFHSRVSMSFTFCLIFIVANSLLIWRSLVYKKFLHLSSIETWTSYILFKFVLPLFLPFLMSGFPLAIQNLKNNEYIFPSVFVAILSPMISIYYIFLMGLIIVPRVLLEDVLLHEWLPILAVASVSNSTLLTMFSSLFACVKNNSNVGISIWMCIQSFICGLLVFRFTATPKRKTSVIVGSVGIAGAAVSLIQAVNCLIPYHVAPEIILVVAIISYVIIFILLHFINTKMIIRYLELFDECMGNPESAQDLMQKHMTSPYIFLGYMRSTLEYCHPFFMSFEPFNYAMSKWPTNLSLLLFFGRILSFFPSKNGQMTWVASLMSQHKSSSSYTSYLLQFKHIARTRQLSITPHLKRQVDDISNQSSNLGIIIRRFWENILQKNISGFWEDIYKINRKTQEIEIAYQQLYDDYPNNELVLKEQLRFMYRIKKDFIEASAIHEKIKTLRRDGHTKADLALSLLQKVFPSFSTVSAEFEQIRNESYLMSLTESRFDEQSMDQVDSQIETAVQLLTKKSTLGRVWVGILFLTLTTFLTIGFYYFFHQDFYKRFLIREKDAINFLKLVNKVIYQLNILSFFSSVYPIFFEGYPASIPGNFMEIVAPSLYPNYVPKINLTIERISEQISLMSEFITDISSALVKLDPNDSHVQYIHTYLTKIDVLDGKNTLELINQLLLDNNNMYIYTNPKDYLNSVEYQRYSIFTYQLVNMFDMISINGLLYSSAIDSDRVRKLNEKFVLVTLTAILLITLPFVLILFKLQIESNSIAESFTFIPNTEIRAIINEFGSNISKIEEDANAIAHISQLASYKNAEVAKQIFVFGLTFIPCIVFCLCTYYSSSLFVNKTGSLSYKIYTLVSPFAQMTSGVSFLVKAALIDTDPTIYLPINETRENIIQLAEVILQISIKSFSQGMWSQVAGVDSLYKLYSKENSNVIDTFRDVFPPISDKVPKPMSHFEQFATADLTHCFDIVLSYALSYLSTHKRETTPANINDEIMQSLVYWFSQFGVINRTLIYFDVVEKYVLDEIGHFETNEQIFISLTIIFQLFGLLAIIMYFLQRHNAIIGSLRFYHFIKAQVLLACQNVIFLIEKSKMIHDKNNATFSNAEFIVNKIGQGIAIVDPSLAVVDFNPAFSSIIQLDDNNELKGKLINELIMKEDGDSSWTDFMVNLNECIVGKYNPRFTQNITGKLRDGQVVHFACSVIAMNSCGPAEDGDTKAIEKVAIIFDDCTQMNIRQQIIQHEMNLTREILAQSMPDRLIDEFVQNGCEGLSFVANSISICQLKVCCDKEFEKGSNTSYKIYEEIFEMFDKEIKNFDLLCKARIFGNIYVLVGGIFAEVNKPEKHAEQAARFALKMIDLTEEYSQNTGSTVEITAGMHTGGPTVIGIMENQRPSLQIIGPVMEMATQMTLTGLSKQLQVTRAVYEIIFSAGFHIVERGDTLIRGEQYATTYLVSQK
ncbi:hypothetical protein TRFO_01967 [Tritrichomonas foetus]|uniref:Guanylate cyclase domain-containing protein n=1 Tax=Tritrichomonas foetus TaxID=1144522 RepID=A0A1J4JCF8_9EUKA|nr:hypothetical protein TRFO_01967 [Tritrichomonas foetus]|eukprot:OHS96882.1 hypothetical protein TRFO_01967 [Tritrichomonas foetus]